MSEPKSDLLPDMAIRRFDVFAEYTRQERIAKGEPADEAKGYGIWLAKVVASRRFGSKSDDHDKSGKRTSGSHLHQKFRSVGDEEQTDRVFDHDIIDRMGEDFYEKVFSRAIMAAREHGERYEEIRDAIRKEWKPAKKKS